MLPNTLKPMEFRSYLHVLFFHVACIKPEILNKLKLKLGVEQILFTVVHFESILAKKAFMIIKHHTVLFLGCVDLKSCLV